MRKVAAVTLNRRGHAQNYLVGRQPIRDFPASNGHGRAAPGTSRQPAVGTLILKEFGAGIGADLTTRINGRWLSEESKAVCVPLDTLGRAIPPRLLYRVYSSDGHEELVRGAVFNELDVRALRNDLIAVGDDPLVSNRMGGVPETIICPSSAIR